MRMKMVSRRKITSEVAPSLATRAMLWLSAGDYVDGMWVGSYFQTHAEKIRQRVGEALRLIKERDPMRYARVIHDLDRIWVRLLTSGVGQFDPSLRACLLDERFVLSDTSGPDLIAATIVHEATHARLWARGLRYDEAIRARIEAICLRRELAFASKIPNSEKVHEFAEDVLTISPSIWTDAAFQGRDHEGALEVLRHLGFAWLTPAILAFRKWRSRSTMTIK